MRAMAHDDVFVLGRDDDNSVGVVTNGWWFVFFVANIAVEIRGIGTRGGEEFGCRHSCCGVAEKVGIHQRNLRHRRLAAPEIEMKGYRDR